MQASARERLLRCGKVTTLQHDAQPQAPLSPHQGGSQRWFERTITEGASPTNPRETIWTKRLPIRNDVSGTGTITGSGSENANAQRNNLREPLALCRRSADPEPGAVLVPKRCPKTRSRIADSAEFPCGRVVAQASSPAQIPLHERVCFAVPPPFEPEAIG